MIGTAVAEPTLGATFVEAFLPVHGSRARDLTGRYASGSEGEW